MLFVRFLRTCGWRGHRLNRRIRGLRRDLRGSRKGTGTLELDAGNIPQCKSNRSDGGQPDADYMTSKLVEKASDGPESEAVHPRCAMAFGKPECRWNVG